MALYDPQDKHTFRHDLTPYENEALSIGRSNRRFSVGYFRDLIADSLTLLSLTIGTLIVTTKATVPAPVDPTDAATKFYVDSAAAGITVKESDGAPSTASVTSLEIDQSTGLVTTSPGANRATVAINQVPITKGGTGSAAIVAGYVKSNGAALSGQATPLPAADGGLGAALPAAGYLKGGASVGSQAVPIPAADGGTGVISPTAHGVLIGEGASAVVSTVLTNGQVLIGSTGADPVAASLTAGAGIVLTPGAGSLAIASTISSGATLGLSYALRPYNVPLI